MKILDELERLVIKPQLSYEERHLLELHRLETLPALIRAARAAEFYCNALTPNGQAQRKQELREALQQLRAVGTADERDLTGEEKKA